MEQIYHRYFTQYCWDLMQIYYGYDLELCTSFRDHIELKPYDFENKCLTIAAGSCRDVRYVIEELKKHYTIRVENFEYKDKDLSIDPLDRWKDPQAHKFSNLEFIYDSPEVEDVKIYFDYDFNDDLMKQIKSKPTDVFEWINE